MQAEGKPHGHRGVVQSDFCYRISEENSLNIVGKLERGPCFQQRTMQGVKGLGFRGLGSRV